MLVLLAETCQNNNKLLSYMSVWYQRNGRHGKSELAANSRHPGEYHLYWYHSLVCLGIDPGAICPCFSLATPFNGSGFLTHARSKLPASARRTACSCDHCYVYCRAGSSWCVIICPGLLAHSASGDLPGYRNQV